MIQGVQTEKNHSRVLEENNAILTLPIHPLKEKEQPFETLGDKDNRLVQEDLEEPLSIYSLGRATYVGRNQLGLGRLGFIPTQQKQAL